MNSNTGKPPVSFTFSEEKDNKIQLLIEVGKGSLIFKDVLRGYYADDKKTVVLTDIFNLDSTAPISQTYYTDEFFSLILRVMSIYTQRALGQFKIGGQLLPRIHPWLKTSGAGDILNAGVILKKVEVAKQVFDVTMTNFFAIMHSDPELVSFDESWMDPTTDMMLNAIFEIPKTWKGNLSASGTHDPDNGTGPWIWNWSPSTETMFIHTRQKVNGHMVQWEVTPHRALRLTGPDRNFADIYRPFMQGGVVRWLCTRKVTVADAWILELPSTNLKGLQSQIQKVLDNMTQSIWIDGGTFEDGTWELDRWLPEAMGLEDLRDYPDGQPSAELASAYLELYHASKEFANEADFQMTLDVYPDGDSKRLEVMLLAVKGMVLNDFNGVQSLRQDMEGNIYRMSRLANAFNASSLESMKLKGRRIQTMCATLSRFMSNHLTKEKAGE